MQRNTANGNSPKPTPSGSQMSNQNQGSRKAPRSLVKITPHKGGRTARFEARLTPAEKAIVMECVRKSGLSAADWLMAQAQPTQRAGDTATPSQAGERGVS